MKNNTPDSDNKIKNMFHTEQMDFDQDAMWTDLEAALDKKKRPFPIPILLTVLVLSAAAALIFTRSGNENMSAISANSSIAPATEVTQQADDNNSEEKVKEGIATNENINNATANPVDVSAENTNLHEVESKTSNTIVEDVPTKNMHPVSVIEMSSRSNTEDQSIVKEHTVEYSEQRNNLESNRENSTNVFSNTSEFYQGAIVDVKDEINYLFNKEMTPISTRDVKLITVSISAKKRDWSLCETRNPWTFGVELYGGYAHPLTDYSLHGAFEGPEGRQFLDTWDAANSAVGGYQGGIQIFAQHPNGMEVAGGVEYQRIIEKLETNRTLTEMVRVFDPMAYFYRDENNQIVWVADTVNVTRYINERRTTKMEHTLINIPIRLGYMTSVDNWVLGGHIGGVVHVNYGFDGLVLQPNGSYLDVDDSNYKTIYKDGISFSALIDLHLGRRITDQAELFVKPEFRFKPDSWTQSNHALNMKMHFVQASGGLRYYF